MLETVDSPSKQTNADDGVNEPRWGRDIIEPLSTAIHKKSNTDEDKKSRPYSIRA
jgi:hypothetical protein